MINMVEKQINDVDWTISWEGGKKIRTESDDVLLFEFASTFAVTPEQAFDMAMLQLDWLEGY